jgi:hypothetical protein
MTDENDPDIADENSTADVGDLSVVVERETRIQREMREGDDVWRGLLAKPTGRREIWRLLQSCHTFEERFACGPNGHPQPEATWFHAGERETGLRLYRSFLRIDRESVGRMHDEYDPFFAKPKQRRKGS